MRLPTLTALFLGGSWLAGCAAPATSGPGSSVPASESSVASGPGGSAENSAAAPVQTGPGPLPSSESTAAPSPTAPSSQAPAPVGPGASEQHGRPLPELSVKSFGMHVGGGAKDAAARDDFLRALEAIKWRYLDCYRSIAEPGSVGTFGADLTIGGAGGKPTVGKPRTRLRGEAFQTCMLHAFESVSFGRPPSGRAVVLSYSVKFSLTD